MSSRDSALLPAVAIAFVAAVALVGSGGDFPLSDDWAYAHVVRSLVDGRGFDFLPWTGATLVAQALYGAAACKLAGFSHTVLRTTTLAMSLGGIAAMHALLRELGASARTAAAGAFALAFSPLWFHLSFTFMTDVPFVALAITGAALVVRGLQRETRTALLGAGAVLAAAFLIRQHAVWIAAAAALTALMPSRAADAMGADARGADAMARTPDSDIAARETGERGPFSRMVDAACVVALALAATVAWTLWAATSDAVPLAVRNKLGEAAATGVGPAMNAAFRAAATGGFLLLPWAWTARPRSAPQLRAFAACLLPLLAAAAFAYLREGAAMFYLTNVLGDFTVGAATTRDLLFLGLQHGPALDAVSRTALTLASLASAATVASRIGLAMRPSLRRPSRAAVFLVATLLLAAAGSLVQAHWYFDRYVLLLLPLAAAALVALEPSMVPGPGFAAAALALAAYGVAGTHDYMEWNRARWDLLAGLEAGGADANRIDGGVEYNAERLAARLRTAPEDADARRGQSVARKSWWWVQDDEWIIAFEPLDGYAEVASRNYTRWLPPGEDRVLVLHRRTD